MSIASSLRKSNICDTVHKFFLLINIIDFYTFLIIKPFIIYPMATFYNSILPW